MKKNPGKPTWVERPTRAVNLWWPQNLHFKSGDLGIFCRPKKKQKATQDELSIASGYHKTNIYKVSEMISEARVCFVKCTSCFAVAFCIFVCGLFLAISIKSATARKVNNFWMIYPWVMNSFPMILFHADSESNFAVILLISSHRTHIKKTNVMYIYID